VETAPQIRDTYIARGEVRLIYRHLIQLGQSSLRAAEASECAAEQDKFWEMHEAIYVGQAAIYGQTKIEGALTVFAQEIGLDLGAYNACMVSGRHRARIQADFEAAQAAGIRSRPVFDINGTRLIGARPFEDFQGAIDAALGR
jgi:protein-disulfide isomerase